jgi:hypothetical protein
MGAESGYLAGFGACRFLIGSNRSAQVAGGPGP